jgi:hypothetical protein
MHILFIYFILFYFYFLGWVQLNPYGAGLDPASPARSLAQASDLAEQKQHAFNKPRVLLRRASELKFTCTVCC